MMRELLPSGAKLNESTVRPLPKQKCYSIYWYSLCHVTLDGQGKIVGNTYAASGVRNGYVGCVAATCSLSKLASNVTPVRLCSAVARQMLD